MEVAASWPLGLAIRLPARIGVGGPAGNMADCMGHISHDAGQEFLQAGNSAADSVSNVVYGSHPTRAKCVVFVVVPGRPVLSPASCVFVSSIVRSQLIKIKSRLTTAQFGGGRPRNDSSFA